MSELEADFIIQPPEGFDCSFEINAAVTTWGSIEGDIDNQTDLIDLLNTKQDTIEDLSEIREKADTALQPGDDISQLVNDAGYLTEITSLDVTTALGYTPYDSANPNDYQENVIETIQRNGTALTPENKTVNITVPTTAADVGALPDTTTIDDLTTEEQQNALNSGATTTNIGQISTNQNNITTINGKIPEQASSSNQLADKNFVNSSISTNTANFIGTFEDVTTLEAYSGTVTNNDYAFVINSVVTDNGNDWTDFATLDAADKSKLTNFDYAWVINGSNFDLYRFDIVEQEWSLRVQNTAKADVTLNTAYNRYKATEVSNVITWAYEYTLNNSSFTASQWAAINSGATTTNIALIGTINSTISGYGNIVTHNTSEFATAAQGAKADTALQNLATGGTQAIALGTMASATASGSIAYGYSAGATSTYSMAIGWDAGATNTNTIAIGKGAKATASGAIAIGTGAENSTANTFQVKTYELLDLSTGLIPDARISSNIARTTDIPSDYVTTNTAQTISQTKAFSQPIVIADNNGLASGTLLSSKKILQRTSGDSTLTLNNTDNKLRFVGSETRPKYSSDGTNFEELVLLSDVPPGSVVDQTFDGTSQNAQSGSAILPVLYSSKAYNDNGQILSDTILYNYIKSIYHSSFDLSKFTVTGSPTISADGIASGFVNTTNFVRITQTFAISGNYIVKGSFIFKTPVGTSKQCVWSRSASGSSAFFFDYDVNGFRFYNTDGTNTDSLIVDFSDVPLITDGTWVYFECIFTSTQRTLKLNAVGNSLLSFTGNNDTITYNSLSTTIKIGVDGSNYRNLLGSFDLKELSVIQNDTEVFSGNKTGTDTYYTDDYTVVGSPTITDGVASGFSGSDYITSGTSYLQNLGSADTWEIEMFIIYPNTLGNDNENFFSGGASASDYQGIVLAKDGSTKGIRFYLGSSGTGWNIANGQVSSDTFSANQRIGVNIKFTGTQYILSTKISGENWKVQNTVNSTTKIYSSNLPLLFGNNKIGNSRYWTGSIDLKTIKITVNGRLEYTPKLYVPYHKTNNGVLIADEGYRDYAILVGDTYGYSPYFTIDTTNQNVTLPMPDLYSMIAKATPEFLKTVSGYNGSATQTLKNVNGVLTWVTD